MIISSEWQGSSPFKSLILFSKEIRWEPKGAGAEICGLVAMFDAPGRDRLGGGEMNQIFRTLLRDDEGQDIAEYAVMLAVILVIVVGTVRLIGSNANTVFSQVASAIP